MRGKEGYNKDSYVIKNEHKDCTKDTYEMFQKIVSPINIDLKYLMNKNNYLYFKWDKDIIQIFIMKKDNNSLSNYVSVICVPIRI